MAGRNKGGRGSGRRRLATRVKTARGRKPSSTRWLQRQLNDPYVAEAERRGFRSRAAFKLIELDDRFHFLATGRRVVDLGAAPGGWTQVAVRRVGPKGRVVAIDLQPIDAIEGATILEGDFLDPDATTWILQALAGPADVVLSDMASPATGHASTDHLRIVALCEAAFAFAEEALAPGGTFLAKVFKGGTEGELLHRMQQRFRTVRHAKPAASRPESAESYVIAMGFKGGDEAPS
ncbi:MAG: RlmE family RNA methyltransferase [Alphaproteobacteria bacterium]|nr:RlmE family RNA methyltransferase [Alphaproteobacteria bacterium]